MGIATVAVYSELDRDALHVRLADEAFALGGTTAAESYINSDKLLEVIRNSGCDGVHPGYGFFSENPDFARAVEALGVEFIGPPPSAMDEMSDKVSSRQAAVRGGAPIVPGTTEFAKGADEIRDFGNEFGWPVCIKAAFGGGGRGMKVVHSAEEVDDAMASAQREALSFFGRDEVYVERYLTWPRHVEIQLVGDKQGNCVWISSRDCSAQRRHQKLIEEAPAPGLPEGVEAAMGEAAVKAALAVGYYGAGTVEFIYQDGDFFFLEMNTRLQVEHCVSEMITDIDLVEWQIRVAAGEPLCGRNACVPCTTPQKLMFISHSKSRMDCAAAVAPRATPALLTIMFTVPCCSATNSAQANTASRSATSTVAGVTLTPKPSHRSTVSASPVSSTSLGATCAPRRASSTLSALPIPEPAPVTATTFPAKFFTPRSTFRARVRCA